MSDSDAKDAERGRECNGRNGWTAIRTQCARGVGRQKPGRSIRDYDSGLDYRHLRSNVSRKVEAFSRDAIRAARLRRECHTHCLKTRLIHGCVIMNHFGHAVRRLSAVMPALRTGVALTHERADASRRNSPGQQRTQENDRG